MEGRLPWLSGADTSRFDDRFGELCCDRLRCWTGYNEFIRLGH